MESFWSRVERSPACWLWQGRCTGKGYGALDIIVEGSRRTVATHRLAWELTYGPIPEGKQVCHRCDVRNCVRPDHLFLCTQSENILDMWAKGRGQAIPLESHLRGEQHKMARLTEDQVLEMRRLHAKGGITFPELAERFGVGVSTAHDAVRGKKWKHLPLDGGPARVHAL